MYRTPLIIVAFSVVDASAFAQNKLNLVSWTIGLGNIDLFERNGEISENTREWGEGPNNKRVILWKVSPDGNIDGDGGSNGAFFPIQHGDLYRFTIWIKKTNSHDGISYFGCENVSALDGTPANNPYFWYGDFPELNKRYLLVGYIHEGGDNSTESYGGIYDGSTGLKVVNITDYKFALSITHSRNRSYLFYDPNTADRQFFYVSRVDLINGNEPSTVYLLALEGSSSDKTYFSGKVGTANVNPSEKLAVKRNTRAQEIRVKSSTWTDYVFHKEYKLPSLAASERHMKKERHLPGIPSSGDVITNGILVGERDAKLLRKIKEITLHLICQNHSLENQNESRLLSRGISNY